MSEKLCIFCKHMEFREDDYIHGYIVASAGHKCGKGYWPPQYPGLDTRIEPTDIKAFRKTILFARDCPDYKTAK